MMASKDRVFEQLLVAYFLSQIGKSSEEVTNEITMWRARYYAGAETGECLGSNSTIKDA